MRNFQLHECTVCGILDGDYSRKECSYCSFCDAWLCKLDISSLVRRAAAAYEVQKLKLKYSLKRRLKEFDFLDRIKLMADSASMIGEWSLNIAGGGPPAYVTGQTGYWDGSAWHPTPATITVSSGQTIIVGCYDKNGTTTVTMGLTDSLGNTVGATVFDGKDGGVVGELAIWIYHVTVGGSDLVTCTDGNNSYYRAAAIGVYSGSATLDQSQHSNNTSSTNPQVTGTTATTTNANEIVVGIFGTGTGSAGSITWTAESSPLVFNARLSETSALTAAHIFLEDYTASSTGTFQATAVPSTLDYGVGWIGTLY